MGHVNVTLGDVRRTCIRTPAKGAWRCHKWLQRKHCESTGVTELSCRHLEGFHGKGGPV